jgi:hypothetical protein
VKSALKQLQGTDLGENGIRANIPEVSSAGISSLVNFVKDIAACIYHILSELQKHFGNSLKEICTRICHYVPTITS